jgi:hypothetical protein
MRALVASLMTTVLLAIPSSAHADGGAYISLNKTYYVAGDTAVATGYVAIPKSKRSLIGHGPFYAYAMDNRTWLRTGQPIPAAATRLGTFTVHPEQGWFEFEARFTVPSLSFGWHHLALCNDPCTIDRFREPLRGQFAVVETAREAQLLIQNGRLHGQLSAARRNVSKVEDRLEESDRDLATAMRAASRSGDEILALRAQVITAQEDAAAVHARVATEHRAATIVAVELMLGALALLVVRRMRATGRLRPNSASSSRLSLLRRSP